MTIQLELFNVSEFLEKSSNPFFEAMQFVRKFNYYMRLYKNNPKKEDEFFYANQAKNKIMFKIAVNCLDGDLFLVHTWKGYISLMHKD